MALVNNRRYWGVRQQDHGDRKVYASGCDFLTRTLGIYQAEHSGRAVYAGGTCTSVGDMDRVPGVLQATDFNGKKVYAVACCPGGSSSSGSGSGSGSGSSASGSGSSASGSSSGITRECSFCPDGAPLVWKVTVADMASQQCTTCEAGNGVWYMDWCGGCEWNENNCSSISGDRLGCTTDAYDGWKLNAPGGISEHWQLYPVQNAGNGGFYICPVDEFDCLGPNVFTQFWTPSILDPCAMPATVLIEPA